MNRVIKYASHVGSFPLFSQSTQNNVPQKVLNFYSNRDLRTVKHFWNTKLFRRKSKVKVFHAPVYLARKKVTKFSNYFSTIHSPQAHSKQNVKRTKDKNSERPRHLLSERWANVILIAEICAKFCKIISGVSSAEIQRKILSLKIPSQIGPLCCQIQEIANSSKSGNRARLQIRGKLT